LLQEQSQEALVITADANRCYISGFSGSSGILLVSNDHALVLTDFRYRIRVAQEAPSFTLHEIKPNQKWFELLPEIVAQLGLKQVAFESNHMTIAQHKKLTQAFQDANTPPIELVPAEGLVEKLRMGKDEDEIVTLRRAIAITDAAIEAILPELTPHHTERQAAWMLEVAMRERGADSIGFPIIVASGTNAALPHARTGDAPLETGCPIIIDMGAVYQGYHADLSRTIVLGEPDARFHEIYHTVLAAQQHAIAHIRPGMTGKEADALARDRITQAGYAEAFGHGLGHGVGLEIHEAPTLRMTSEDELRVGNVFSIEPGIYLEDWGGVRIEDLVLLHEHGCEVLSQAIKYQE
jgi:Xaa-Pro aminopeptidase